MTVFDSKNNIALEVTRIEISYLVNKPASEKNMVSLSILLLGEIELKWYNTNGKTSPFLHI